MARKLLPKRWMGPLGASPPLWFNYTLSCPLARDLPAASTPICLWSLLLLGFLVQLSKDETVPALNQPSQVHLPCGFVRVSQDEPQC